MTFLPIVARELRVASRRPGTYRVRWGAALVLIGIGAWYFLIHPMQSAQDTGVRLFWGLTGSVVLYCLLKGVWSTADSLSEEKREGTLGLLFLTDLRGYDVVLGKLAATSLNGLYAVLAAVPILALPLLMGGVTPGEVGRMALVAVNALFFSLALGICVSAMSRSPLKAMAITFGLILLFTVVLPACGGLLYVLGRTPQVGKGWLVASAGFSYYQALAMPYAFGADDFWQSVAVIHGLGWAFLLLACVITPRAWQVRPAGVQALRWRERWREWSYGEVGDRSSFRRRLLDRSAYFWLAARARLKPAYVWAVLGLVACGWVWGLARSHRDWLDEATYILTGLVLNLVIKVWFALEAGRQLGDDRKEGALELLLSTPLTVKDILHGQLLALRRQFQGPVVVVLLVFFVFMLLGASDTLSRPEVAVPSLWVLLWAGAMVMLVADLAGLYWLGMWRGLTARDPTRAALENLACILLLPWVGTSIGMVVVTFRWPDATEPQVQQFFTCLWFGLGLAADLGFGLWARHKLLTEFRLAATRRYERTPGLWRRFRRFRGTSLP